MCHENIIVFIIVFFLSASDLSLFVPLSWATFALHISYLARATSYDFFLQVSVNDSAEEADHIETNGAASVCSAAIFSLQVFAENEQPVHVKSQWCA